MADSGFIETDGAKLYYEVEGAGHPLLLIHGGLGNLRMWDGQVPAFSERYRVIRYDTRGFGRTETEDIEFRDYSDAAAVLDHVGADSALVVGQSRGGVIALDLTIDRPDRVDALVSVAGGISGFEAERTDPPPWSEMERFWNEKDWAALAELETQVWVDGWGQPPDRVDPEVRQQVFDWIRTTYEDEKIEGKPKRLDPPAAERLGEVRAPTLVLIGTVDEQGGVAAERHLATSVAGARVIEFENVAHMIQLEEPERFNLVVLDFLAEVDREREASALRTSS